MSCGLSVNAVWYFTLNLLSTLSNNRTIDMRQTLPFIKSDSLPARNNTIKKIIVTIMAALFLASFMFGQGVLPDCSSIKIKEVRVDA